MKLVKKLQKGKPINKKDLDDYYTQRINAAIKEAIDVMNTREYPRVFYSTNPEAYRGLLSGNLKEQANEQQLMDINYWLEEGKDLQEAKALAKEAAYEYAAKRIDLGLNYEMLKYSQENGIPVPDGATCLYTVTDSYGTDRAIPGNLTWLNVYKDKGFRRLRDDEPLEQGDILQLGQSKNSPTHAVMFLDYLEPAEDVDGGEILGRYSSGGYNKEALNTTNWLFIPSKHNAFRFVGTSADSLRWLEDYKSKLK